MRPPRPGKACSRRRMNMTGAPPATESGKPGCPLLDKTSHRQLRHVGNGGTDQKTQPVPVQPSQNFYETLMIRPMPLLGAKRISFRKKRTSKVANYPKWTSHFALRISAFGGKAEHSEAFYVCFPSYNTLAILDAIRRDIAPTRLVTSCFCASQICTIASIQGVATSSDLSFFAFLVYPCAFELALLLLGQCD